MNSKDDFDSTKDVSPEINLRIDEICDAFESCYLRNESPRIEDYLDATLGAVATQLVELVSVEVAYRKKAGERPTALEYASRFPEYSGLLTGLISDFESTEPDRHWRPPRIEGLESFEFVGAGSFGVVWKAWDFRLRRFVAVKVPIRPVPTPRDRELSRREAQVVARIKHPHIVPVLYCGETDDRVYVVYEFIAGMTLRARLDAGPLPHKTAAALCQKVAGALYHVHQRDIVHRDLKPANILVDSSDEPFVMDFGLAKLLDVKSTIGASGHPLGTLAYMSPEQAAGHSRDTDKRSDLYSLGVILYELVTGTPAVLDKSGNLTANPLIATPPTFGDLAAAVPPPLNAICRRCMEPDKRDRYASAAALSEDLRRFLADEPVSIRPTPRWIRAARSVWRHQRLAAALVLSGASVMFVLIVWQRPPEPAPDLQPRQVQFTTKPEGASVAVLRCDPKTGEPDMVNWVALVGSTPGTIELPPGRYLLNLKLGETLSHEVHRTVPDLRSWPSMGAAWERAVILPNHGVKWPEIVLAPVDAPFERTYIEGTEEFVIRTPDGDRKISIPPFYVATREFTFGDFLVVRPGEAGNIPDRPAYLQPAGNTMAAEYQWAEHFAEAAGARLLTDLEFAYLAKLASDAQSQKQPAENEAALFDIAGGSAFDQIPKDPPVRGILTGYAEWTSTWSNSPRATVRCASGKEEELRHPEQYRIIRGGQIDCRPTDYPRGPQTAVSSLIYGFHPHVGFRLAWTPPVPLKPKAQ